MRKVGIGGVGLALIALALVALVAAFGRGMVTRTDGGVAGADVVRVVRRDIGTVVKATGVIKPMIGAEVRVGSRLSGVVRRLYVRVGDTVRKGQILAELDDRELFARRAEAAAALEVAEANLRYAVADRDRRRALRADQLIAPSDLDLAERACIVADKQRRGAEASLDYAVTQLEYARIVAPIGGVVASVSTQEGETVAASFATPMFVTLLDLSRLEVWAYVDETDIGRIRRGQRAFFTVDTYGNHEFDGRVTAIYPQAAIRDNVVNYVAVVRFSTSGPPGRAAAREADSGSAGPGSVDGGGADAGRTDAVLRPEMTAAVRIALETRSQVLAVPLRAVRREAGRQFVWARRGDALERRWVTVGSRDERHCEIVDGLREGDEVVVGEVEGGTDGTISRVIGPQVIGPRVTGRRSTGDAAHD